MPRPCTAWAWTSRCTSSTWTTGNLAQGNLGESLTTREGVWHEFLTLFPATLELSLAAMLFAGTFGLLAGVIAALKRGSLFDHG